LLLAFGKESMPHIAGGTHAAQSPPAAWLSTARRCAVLTIHEERVRDDILRSWTEEAEEPPRLAPSSTKRASRAQADVPAAIGVSARITIILLLFGAAQAALAVAVATALGWALWHHWPRLSGQRRIGDLVARRQRHDHPRTRR
jgi:hypothetical protein